MIEIGKIQTLYVTKLSPYGVYLNVTKDQEDKSVLLPNNQVKENSQIGDSYEVFVYRDSKDRLIATVNRPKLVLGEVALLEVTSVTDIGAFIDWGLEKDLFLPYKQMKEKVRAGKDYLFGLYVDKSSRLCATMDIHYDLKIGEGYNVGDWIEGTVYTVSEKMGVFVAVDNQYMGLIPAKEVFEQYRIGQNVRARVSAIKEDGKIDLSVREKTPVQMDIDAEFILTVLQSQQGVLYLNDKSNPEEIKNKLTMSKASFKRAVGRLLKEGKIKQDEEGIKLL